MSSYRFDVEFEAWLQQQLDSIKSFKKQSKLATATFSSAGSCDVTMSRDREIARSKHGGGVDYYHFTYDEDESFDDGSSIDDVPDNDEAKRRQRLARILGDSFGGEYDDNMATSSEMIDSGITGNSTAGFDTNHKFGAIQLSSNSLDFSDTMSMASDVGSDVIATRHAATAAITSLEETDCLERRRRENSVDGFIEFQRSPAAAAATGNQFSQPAARIDIDHLDETDDPLQYELCKPDNTNTKDNRQLPDALVSAISGRRLRQRQGSARGSGKTQSAADVAIRFYKTDMSADDVIGSEEFLDDDDMLVHPQHHQLPVSSDVADEKETMTSSVNSPSYRQKERLMSRSVLPIDLSLDIMSPEDPFNPVGDETTNDEAAFHSGGDLDPIFKDKSVPAGSPVSRVSQHLARTFSGSAKTGRIPWSKKYRCLVIFAGVVVGLLVVGGAGVAMYFAVR